MREEMFQWLAVRHSQGSKTRPSRHFGPTGCGAELCVDEWFGATACTRQEMSSPERGRHFCWRRAARAAVEGATGWCNKGGAKLAACPTALRCAGSGASKVAQVARLRCRAAEFYAPAGLIVAPALSQCAAAQKLEPHPHQSGSLPQRRVVEWLELFLLPSANLSVQLCACSRAFSDFCSSCCCPCCCSAF